MTETALTIGETADSALKQKHAAMWASGHYEAVATDLIAELGPVLVDATGIGAGDLVLDIAAGSGNVAIPAALAGARVIASDLTPELLEEGARQAATAGAVLEWQVADAEHLPYDDGGLPGPLLEQLGSQVAGDHSGTGEGGGEGHVAGAGGDVQHQVARTDPRGVHEHGPELGDQVGGDGLVVA